MKSLYGAIAGFSILLAAQSHAGVNGTYHVSGSETYQGDKYSFTGTVKISNFNKGVYSLKFDDGEKTTYSFEFDKKIKETPSSQTVTAKNDLGTSEATIYKKDGVYRFKFSYKSFDGSVKGRGTGRK